MRLQGVGRRVQGGGCSCQRRKVRGSFGTRRPGQACGGWGWCRGAERGGGRAMVVAERVAERVGRTEGVIAGAACLEPRRVWGGIGM